MRSKGLLGTMTKRFVVHLFSPEMIKEKRFILTVFLLALVPITWYRPKFMIAAGDYFPLFLRAQNTIYYDVFLWTEHNLGGSSLFPCYILYEAAWLLLQKLGFSVNSIQILILTLSNLASGLGMYWLTRLIYPRRKYAPFFASIFYMFNLAVVERGFYHRGILFTYSLLPLLMAFLVKITIIRETKSRTKHVILFAMLSVPVFSLASFNTPNIVLISLSLAAIIGYAFLFGENGRQFVRSLIKLAVLGFFMNVWLIVPLLSYSLGESTPELDVWAWSWTHRRASFLNLFALNPSWGWTATYVPYIEVYSNPILVLFKYIPVLLGFSALLFKSEKHLNTYFSTLVLLFLFLAKGLHEPFAWVNLLLYENIPTMASLFRNPTSKFTLTAVPFLALLIGFTVDKILVRIKRKLLKGAVVALLISIFLAVSFPIITGQAITGYVKFPSYWYDASDWLNDKWTNESSFKVLLLPPDDFYNMGYNWGYYGADGFPSRLICAPTIQQPSGYKVNREASLVISELYAKVKDNPTARERREFNGLLDLLNIRYILQRNDIRIDLPNRQIVSPDTVRQFLENQPNTRLVKKFGALDIYEYTGARVKEDITVAQPLVSRVMKWNFNGEAELRDWQETTPGLQFSALQTLSLEDGSLKIQLYNSTGGWKNINSPFIPTNPNTEYHFELRIKAVNVIAVHCKIFDCNSNKELIRAQRTANIGGYENQTFYWKKIFFTYVPSTNTSYMQLRIWHGKETPTPLPNRIWLDYVYVYEGPPAGLLAIWRQSTRAEDEKLEEVFISEQFQAEIIQLTRIDPTQYMIEVNATKPFMLSFSQAYDPLWIAHVNGERIEPIPLYSVINGFWINQTGQLEITIEYEPQKWFYYGSIISVTTFLACLTYLTYNWTKNKAIWKRTRRSIARVCLILRLNRRKKNMQRRKV